MTLSSVAMQKTRAIETALLKSQMMASSSEFLCFSELPNTLVEVLFIGRFQDRDVVWEMRLRSIGEQGKLSFMEITPDPSGNMLLKIELAVSMIDETIIKKTIIMIRNYRRIKVGRHEWGTA